MSEKRERFRRASRLCVRCYGRMAGQAFSEGKCEACGDIIVSATWPCDKICDKCAIEKHLCRHCGRPLEEDV